MNNAHQLLSKKIQTICDTSKQGLNPKQVIDDMVQLACNLCTEEAFIYPAFPECRFTEKAVIRNELSAYKTDSKVWELLQELVEDYLAKIKEAEPFEDILGGLYDPYLGVSKGQFLTPNKLAEGLNKFLDIPVETELTKPIFIGDMTGCGAGTLILALLRDILAKQGKEGVARCHVIVNDVDGNMVRMATAQIILNASLHNIPMLTFSAYQKNVITEYNAINMEAADVLYVFQK